MSNKDDAIPRDLPQSADTALASTTNSELISKTTRGITGQVLELLGQMIVSGELRTDQVISPDAETKRLKVSRTVLREALRILAEKGMIEPRPGVGTRVLPITNWNVLDQEVVRWRASGPDCDTQERELSEVRMMLEPVAARLAAGRSGKVIQQRLTDAATSMDRAVQQNARTKYIQADARFHALLLDVTDNHLLRRLGSSVMKATDTSGSVVAFCEFHPEVARHHIRVTDCLNSGDSQGAEDAMRQALTGAPQK